MGRLTPRRRREPSAAAAAIAIAVGAMGLAGAGPAAALDVRPGLWEQTVTTDMANAGMPAIPPDVLAKLPAEQRARLQAMTAGGPQSRTTQVCLTAEQLAKQDKDPFSGFDNGRMQCTRDIRTNTARRMEARVTCTAPQRMTAEGLYEAPDDRTMTGSTVVTRPQDGRDTTMTMRFKGRWIGADCGSVAPDKPSAR